MKPLATILATMLLMSGASEVTACSMAPEESKLKQDIDNLLKNKRVKQDADCSYKNGGSYDGGSGEAAVDLGRGRIGQRLSYDRMLLVVCGEKQAVVLQGTVVSSGESSCGFHETLDLDTALPPKGRFDLSAGSDFAGFLRYARQFGMKYSEDLKGQLGMERSKDRIDLLCGCKVFYPEMLK